MLTPLRFNHYSKGFGRPKKSYMIGHGQQLFTKQSWTTSIAKIIHSIATKTWHQSRRIICCWMEHVRRHRTAALWAL